MPSASILPATRELPSLLVETPRVINVEVPGTDWSMLAEMSVPDATGGA